MISKQTYTATYDDCKDPDIIKKTDGNEDGTKIVLFWSGIEVPVAWDSGTTWNREHVWPKANGWFIESGAGSDLHHIRPTDPSVNTSHNNNPYGIVSTNDYCKTSSTNGSVTIDAKCKNGVFEPGNDKKGDTARIIFYLLVRYSDSDSYPITNVAESMELLLEWNELDPVDESEIRRNDAVYDIQGNRNPFIDNSDYADLIWGDGNSNDNTGSGNGSGDENNPIVPKDNVVATFELGENDASKSDTDSTSELSNYTETNNNYTLKLNNLSKIYTSYDASGNSCLKAGAKSNVGSFNFTVPDEIDKVVMQVTGYKSNKATISVNGNTQTISTYSSNSEYTDVEIDTTNNKNITFTTTSSGYRCKINTIIFYDFDNESNDPTSEIDDALNAFKASKTMTSLNVNYQYNTYVNFTPKTYTYSFTKKVYSNVSTLALNEIDWTLSDTQSTDLYFGYDSTKGHQLGSSNKPFSELIFKTADNSFKGVTSVSISASGASGTNAKISAYIGDTQIGDTKSLTTSNQEYTFTSSTELSGEVKFIITQTSKKAIYIKGMSFNYIDQSSYVEEYTLNSAGIRFGSYVTKEVYDLLNNENTLWGVEYAVGSVSDWANANVKTIICSPAQVETPNSITTSVDGNYYQWSLLVTNLNYSHLDKIISARVFVEYEGVRYYMSAETYSLRTLAGAYLTTDLNGFENYIGILNHLNDYKE